MHVDELTIGVDDPNEADGRRNIRFTDADYQHVWNGYLVSTPDGVRFFDRFDVVHFETFTRAHPKGSGK